MKNSKNFKCLTMLSLGFALVSGSRLATVGNVNATTNATTTADLARYTHILTVATIDRREVVRCRDGVSLVTYSTDADGTEWINSFLLAAAR